MNDKLVEFIESSFIGNLLKKESVTDVTYNGVSIFYVDNKYGRQKADIEVTSAEVLDFIRQVANYAEKQFSYAKEGIINFSTKPLKIIPL